VAGKARILIVDDEKTLAFFLKQSLLRDVDNIAVDTATSGEEALVRIGQWSYDLILVDLRLPGMNGLELIARIREQLPQAQTVLMTAYGNDAVAAAANRLKVFRYITKPFRLPEITSTVKEALEKMAVSSREVLVLSDSRFEAVTRVLEQLSREVGAQCILMADSLGQMITSVGFSEGIDLALVTSLVAAGFATSFELMRYLGQQNSRNLSYFEGQDYDIYTSNIGENLFLVLIFGKRASLSRIGTVWLYTKRTVAQLQEMLPAGRMEAEEALALDDDFALDLGRLLDAGLTDTEPTASPPATVSPSQPVPRPMSAGKSPPQPTGSSMPPREPPTPGRAEPPAPSPLSRRPGSAASILDGRPPAAKVPNSAGQTSVRQPIPGEETAGGEKGVSTATPAPEVTVPTSLFSLADAAAADNESEGETRMTIEEARRQGLITEKLYRQFTGQQ